MHNIGHRGARTAVIEARQNTHGNDRRGAYYCGVHTTVNVLGGECTTACDMEVVSGSERLKAHSTIAC
ncbi:hypothetical protein AMTR_s00072p00166120 [Amborella trichopoda]|uniref:Uncharacterized protein n=1 Tax=Amborella trichopoda TaxID=13333 RepID=W1NTI4_AMBTC|nr:hypothetical protein AMTR_s00072p00166120 [Amborella trichopoda]